MPSPRVQRSRASAGLLSMIFCARDTLRASALIAVSHSTIMSKACDGERIAAAAHRSPQDVVIEWPLASSSRARITLV